MSVDSFFSSLRSAGPALARAGAAAAIVAALNACQNVPPTNAVRADFRRVGVVSVAARELTQREVGAQARDERLAVREITPWGVDAAYEDQLAAAVQSALGATAVRAPYPLADLVQLNDPATPYIQRGFAIDRADPISISLRGYCADNHLDALVVATRATDEDLLGGSYRPLIGAGLYAHGGSGFVHLSASLTLIDCEIGRPLERHRLAGAAFASSHGYPARVLPGELVHKDMAHWSADEEDRIRRALIELPRDAWAETLAGMVRSDDAVVFGRFLRPNG
jgi:hypothetical protein